MQSLAQSGTGTTSSQDRILRLRDGRLLGYREYGERSGKPVLFFPGTPSSRLMHPPEEISRGMGARLFVIERPGFGLSTFQKNRRLIDWPVDVEEFARSLDLDRFGVVGVSAGGPYAAACAWAIPQRVGKAAIVGGVGPTDFPGAIQEMPAVRRAWVVIAIAAPWLLPAVLWLTANPRRNPERFFQKMLAGNSDVDREFLSQPALKWMLIQNYQEATRAGLSGFTRESIILSNSWGFLPEEITIPVALWHSEEDCNVSLSAVRQLSGRIPNCQVHYVPGEGHWLFMTRWSEILRTVL